MCKTRSKDNAAAQSAQQQQPPSLRRAGCDAAPRVPPVAAGDAGTMQRILARDQRTTYHRLTSIASSSSTTTTRTPSVRQQAAQPRDAAAGSAGCCPLPEILGLIGDGVPWCLARAKCHEREPQSFFASARASIADVEQQRSQRTCKVQRTDRDDSAVEDSHPPVSHCQAPKHTSYRHRSLVALVTWLRLIGLLVALSLASVESAPTAMTLESRRLDQAPKWLNPCGFAAEEFEGDLDVVQLNDATLLGNIVMQAKTALNYAHGFRDDFIKKTFNTDFADLHLTWKDNHYDWLPSPKQIPKQLGEHLQQDYIHKLEVRMLDSALLDAYEYMQRYAVGLEQIAWDQEDYALDFRKQFKDTEYNLRSVLCELQMALAERGVTPRPDVTREVMSLEFRDMSESATYRNLRDWLIFRDYMNGLEYVVQVFEHFIRCFES